MLLVQISDLHVTEPGRLLCDRVDTAAYLRRCVERVAALDPRPDAVLATGDLVDRGTRAEYERLRELLAPLALPIYLALGNHDDRAAFREVFGDAPYLRDTEHVQYAFDAGPLRVLVLDTHDPGRSGGRLCVARRAWLARELASCRDRPTVIAMHHPPFATGIGFMDACGLDAGDTAELAAIVGAHPQVERILCGHLHRSIHARFAGTIAATAPSCAHQVVLGFAPATVPGFTFEPPAFVQHLWTTTLVSHFTYIDRYDGPVAF